ncbi:MAG: Dyp-type peroxidase [Solirubrobacteraceae bacterium]
MSELDLANIQGFVVRGYRLPAAGYLLLHVEDAARARALLGDVLDEVLTAAKWSEKPHSGLNLAISYEGLRALGLPSASLAGFPEEFREGMAARAALLGDTGESAPDRWEAGFVDPGIHVLVMISARDGEALLAHDRRLRDRIERSGALSLVADQVGAALPGGTEHFGFADGFAQPAVEGSGVEALPGQGAPEADGRWRAIRAGEFILGYLDEEGALPPAPAPAPLSNNGSYLVYRKLRQDVAGFRARLAEAARHYHGGEELLGAKIVGRWRDGTPLAVAPEAPDPALVADPTPANDFSYRDDPDGRRCPVGSHIRRVNPRASLPFDGQLVNRHRLVRRGIPYGEPLPEGASDDGADRGVVFMCLQASIARQFEFVQSQWLNDGNAFRLGDDQDVLLGPQDQPGTRKMTVPGSPPFFLGPLARVVTVRGGEYFFCPGLNGLRFLAALGD